MLIVTSQVHSRPWIPSLETQASLDGERRGSYGHRCERDKLDTFPLSPFYSMTTSKFIRKLLGLQDIVVSAFEFRENDRALVLDVKPWGQSGLCPECRRRGILVASTPSVRE